MVRDPSIVSPSLTGVFIGGGHNKHGTGSRCTLPKQCRPPSPRRRWRCDRSSYKRSLFSRIRDSLMHYLTGPETTETLPHKGGAVPESEKRRAAWCTTSPSLRILFRFSHGLFHLPISFQLRRGEFRSRATMALSGPSRREANTRSTILDDALTGAPASSLALFAALSAAPFRKSSCARTAAIAFVACEATFATLAFLSRSAAAFALRCPRYSSSKGRAGGGVLP